MSKLSKVRDALQGNPDVVIVAVYRNNYIPERSGFWSETIDFVVAPKKGLYTAEELQQFMMGLIPSDVELTSKDAFRDWGGDEIELGKLYFDEVIGEELIRRDITLTDEEVLSTLGFVDGKTVLDKKAKLQRRTWVRVYPDPELAKECYEGMYTYHIPKNMLKKGPLARLKAKIS